MFKAVLICLLISFFSLIIGMMLMPYTAAATIEVTETLLTPWGGNKYSAAISQEDVAYVTDQMGNDDVYRLVLGSVDHFAVATGSSTQNEPAIDNGRIVYQDNVAGNQNIYLFDIASGNTTMLTYSASEEVYPAICGNNVVYKSNRLGNNDIYRYDLILSREYVVANTSNIEEHPAVDGNLIVWQTIENGDAQVYAREIGQPIQVVANTSADEKYPDVSQGRIVYLVDNNVEVFEFYSGVRTRLTNDTKQRIYAKISGNFVVWTEKNNDNWDIVLFNLADGQTYQLTDDPWDQYLTDVDGNRAVYWDNRAGYRNIFMLEWTFTNQPPDSFSLLSPEDSSIFFCFPHFPFPFDACDVTFDWEDAVDPDPQDTVRYDLYVSTSSVFSPDSTDTIEGLLNSQHTDTLDLGKYFWTVRAYDGLLETWADDTLSFYFFEIGDVNCDRKVTVSDVVYIINYLFRGGSAPCGIGAGDVNCDGKLTVSDVVYLINYLFKGGPKPSC